MLPLFENDTNRRALSTHVSGCPACSSWSHSRHSARDPGRDDAQKRGDARTLRLPAGKEASATSLTRRSVLVPSELRPRLGRSLLDLATSVVPYLALSVLMYLAVDVSYLLVLAVAVPASGFLVRTYIVFHDCAHGSFLQSYSTTTGSSSKRHAEQSLRHAHVSCSARCAQWAGNVLGGHCGAVFAP
jgi:hypothetical protein